MSDPQPTGVVPASTTYLAPYCTEDLIPDGRLIDSNGAPIGDVPLGLAICAATDFLFKRTRRKFRSGRSVIRPTQLVNPAMTGSMLYPYRSMAGFGDSWGFGASWAWSAVGMGWWQNSDLSQIVLQAPVRRINSVTVDGTVLEPSAYTLYDRRRLVRNLGDGNSPGSWPWNQSIEMPLSEPGTWEIDYEWGNPVPPMGVLAAVELTVELILAISGQDSAALPARVSRVSSQGMDVAVGDALEFLREGFTGLPVVDAFIYDENPARARRRSVFLSPESVLNRST